MASRGEINKKEIQPILSKKWEVIPFVSSIENVGTFPKVKTSDCFEEGAYPVVDQSEKDIAGYINNDELLYKGDLPIVIFGDHTRNIKYVDFPFAAGADGTKILHSASGLDSKFFYYYLKSLQIPNLGYSRHFSILKQLDVPVPSLEEQKQIAAKLDKLFAQIETIKKSTERIPELLKNFRQQILTYAVTGKLTERWRTENEVENEFISIETDKHRDYNYNMPDTWKLLSFSKVVSIESNLVNPNDYKDYPLIAPDNIESMTGRILSKPTVAEISPISSKHYFTKGCLVYSKIRPYLSKVAYVDFDGLCSADMYPLKTKLNIFYLYYYMLSSEFLSYATTAGERIVLPKINQKSLNIIPIPVPPLKEQEEIVKRVLSLLAKLDVVEKKYASLCVGLDKLPQTILYKAFKGELLI